MDEFSFLFSSMEGAGTWLNLVAHPEKSLQTNSDKHLAVALGGCHVPKPGDTLLRIASRLFLPPFLFPHPHGPGFSQMRFKQFNLYVGLCFLEVPG